MAEHQPGASALVLNGRIDNRKGAELNRHLIDLAGYDNFFCGPESMISEVSRGLRGMGIAEDRINYELFGSGADAAERVPGIMPVPRPSVAKSGVTPVHDGRESRVQIAADGENLLDAGLNLGMDLPFACKWRVLHLQGPVAGR